VSVSLVGAGFVWATARDPYLTAWALPSTPITLAVVTLGLLLTRGGSRLEAAPAPPDPGPPLLRQRTRVLLALALLIAFAMRFHAIRELPFSLWRDEAWHGLVALRILEDDTYRPIYVDESHVNLPGFGLYPFALALKLWGVRPWSLRTVTALAGALTVLPLYGLARALTRRAGVGLLAAALLAVSSWHVSLSRFSFPAVFDPFLTLSGLWLLLRSRDATRPADGGLFAAAAGATLGLAVQTYHSARAAPLLAALLVVCLMGRKAMRARVLLPLVLAFGLVLAPLALYSGRHPSALNARVSDVFLLRHAEGTGEAPLSALDASVGRHLLMFNVRGDANGRHHAPGQPLLDRVTGLGFLAGFAVLLARRRAGPSRFLLGALALTLLPSVLAVDGPHAMRSIGAAPYACLIAAIGWLEIARLTSWPRACALAALGLAVVLNVRTYFFEMAVDSRVFASSYPVQTQVGAFLRRLFEERGAEAVAQTYVSARVADNAVFAFLTHGTSPGTFEGVTLSRPPRPGALFILSGRAREEEEQALAPYLGRAPTPEAFGPPFPGGADPSFLVYRLAGP
jgi:4-amino-4-deoxy-L-arabinose transferase-like glycosyltransferase